MRSQLNSEGRLIHPTKKGIDAFWRWFGDSQVVDAKGRPLVVYHGTDAVFDAFDANKGSRFAYGKGMYFSDDRSDSRMLYGNSTMACYLRAVNVAGVDDMIEAFDRASKGAEPFTRAFGVLVRKHLMKKGFDGVSIPDGHSNDWVVFTPSQVKSATGNAGTFSPKDPIMSNPRPKKSTRSKNPYALLRPRPKGPVSAKELALGIKVEMAEHTRSKAEAETIARQHLAGIRDYYTRLIRMEKRAEAYWRKMAQRNPGSSSSGARKAVGTLSLIRDGSTVMAVNGEGRLAFIRAFINGDMARAAFRTITNLSEVKGILYSAHPSATNPGIIRPPEGFFAKRAEHRERLKQVQEDLYQRTGTWASFEQIEELLAKAELRYIEQVAQRRMKLIRRVK